MDQVNSTTPSQPTESTPIVQPSKGGGKVKSNTFSKQLENVQAMLGGLSASSDGLATKGLTAEFIAQLQQTHQEVVDLSSQRNSIKSQSFNLTQQMTTKMKELQTQYSEAKKRVKLELPREKWQAYGFHDQH